MPLRFPIVIASALGVLVLAAMILCAPMSAAHAPPSAQSQHGDGAPPRSDPIDTLRKGLEACAKDPARVVPFLVNMSAELERELKTNPKNAQVIGDGLEPLARRVCFSAEEFPLSSPYGIGKHKVEKNENPTRIVQPLRIGAKMLAYLNQGFDERRLRVGQELRVLDLSDKSLKIEVHKSIYRVFIWRKAIGDGGRLLVACMPCGLGAVDSPTPEGVTTITKRVLDPDWTDPDSKKMFKAGDPKNVLGGYWIALDSAGIDRSGIGMHGFTGDVPRNWIEQPASHGCVRMLQPDIDRVFHVALEGTPVVITP